MTRGVFVTQTGTWLEEEPTSWGEGGPRLGRGERLPGRFSPRSPAGLGAGSRRWQRGCVCSGGGRWGWGCCLTSPRGHASRAAHAGVPRPALRTRRGLRYLFLCARFLVSNTLSEPPGAVVPPSRNRCRGKGKCGAV